MTEDCIENGHCAMHGYEVERRKETKQALELMEKKIGSIEDKLEDKVGKLWKALNIVGGDAANFRGQAKVVGVIATLIFGSSFLYTFNHIQVSNRMHRELTVDLDAKVESVELNVDREFDKLHRLVNANENDIDSLETGALLTNQRLTNIENSTNRIERRLSQLVSILADSGDITTKEKNQWEYIPESTEGGYK